MGCWFHKEKIISTEMLIRKWGYGLMFIQCEKCGMKRIDILHMGENRRGKWVNRWTDNNGRPPKICMKDKKCPKCNRIMEKHTGVGGKYWCSATMVPELMKNEERHYESIEATMDDFINIGSNND